MGQHCRVSKPSKKHGKYSNGYGGQRVLDAFHFEDSPCKEDNVLGVLNFHGGPKVVKSSVDSSASCNSNHSNKAFFVSNSPIHFTESVEDKFENEKDKAKSAYIQGVVACDIPEGVLESDSHDEAHSYSLSSSQPAMSYLLENSTGKKNVGFEKASESNVGDKQEASSFVSRHSFPSLAAASPPASTKALFLPPATLSSDILATPNVGGVALPSFLLAATFVAPLGYWMQQK